MKKKALSRESILKRQLFDKYREEIAKSYDFSELDKEISEKAKRDKQNTNLGRS